MSTLLEGVEGRDGYRKLMGQRKDVINAWRAAKRKTFHVHGG
ncbi:MAG: hypothetical protein QOI89_3567 [Solirubrobacteraceae bacterium]|jgi:hypothetical protein|nr:hypothetical protein [Solirubrobacteraceae bacterium]